MILWLFIHRVLAERGTQHYPEEVAMTVVKKRAEMALNCFQKERKQDRELPN